MENGLGKRPLRVVKSFNHFSNLGWHLIIHPDGKQVAWSCIEDGIYLYSLEEATTKKILSSGTCPAWSPDGKMLAFMNEESRLCLLDIESGRSQSFVWFEPPNLSYKEHGGSYAVKPVWSPDSRMLWFGLTQTRKMPFPRNPSEMFRVAKRYLYPVFYNLNPKRTSHFSRYKHHYHRHRWGILDLPTKQVRLSMGFSSGVMWLP